MKKLTSLLPLLGLLGNAQASWGVGILPKDDDVNLDDDLRALESVLIHRGKGEETADQASRGFPSWPWSGPEEDDKDEKGEEKDRPHKTKPPLWPWTEGKDKDIQKPPREKPLWPWRIPEEDLERPVREPPIHPWGREDLELPPYDGPFVISRQPEKPPVKERKLPPLNVREYRRKRFIKALEQSLDRTKGKTRRVIREPCVRCRHSGGRGPSCRACWAADEADEGSRPIHPWNRQAAAKATTSVKKPEKSAPRHMAQKLLLLKKDKENRVIEVNQINLHFDVDVRQQQQQQEKQGIVQARKLATGPHKHQSHHRHVRGIHSPHNPIQRWPSEMEMERWLRRRYNCHMTPTLIHQASADGARKLRARRHQPYHKRGSRPKEDDDQQSLGKCTKAWKAMKRVLKQWGRSIKKYLGEAAKRFEGESTVNKIALLLVVGLIVALQAMAAMKIVDFCRGQARKNDDAYIRLPREADEKGMI